MGIMVASHFYASPFAEAVAATLLSISFSFAGKFIDLTRRTDIVHKYAARLGFIAIGCVLINIPQILQDVGIDPIHQATHEALRGEEPADEALGGEEPAEADEALGIEGLVTEADETLMPGFGGFEIPTGRITPTRELG